MLHKLIQPDQLDCRTKFICIDIETKPYSFNGGFAAYYSDVPIIRTLWDLLLCMIRMIGNLCYLWSI